MFWISYNECLKISNWIPLTNGAFILDEYYFEEFVLWAPSPVNNWSQRWLLAIWFDVLDSRKVFNSRGGKMKISGEVSILPGSRSLNPTAHPRRQVTGFPWQNPDVLLAPSSQQSSLCSWQTRQRSPRSFIVFPRLVESYCFSEKETFKLPYGGGHLNRTFDYGAYNIVISSPKVRENQA